MEDLSSPAWFRPDVFASAPWPRQGNINKRTSLSSSAGLCASGSCCWRRRRERSGGWVTLGRTPWPSPPSLSLRNPEEPPWSHVAHVLHGGAGGLSVQYRPVPLGQKQERAENLCSHAHLAPWAVPEPCDPWRPCFPHPGDGKTLMAWAARIRENQVFEGLGEAQVTWPCGLGFVDVFTALSCLLEPCMWQATGMCLNG